jgi:hypothetical protein
MPSFCLTTPSCSSLGRLDVRRVHRLEWSVIH